MEELSSYTVFVFLTANGKPIGYSFDYSSNQNLQLPDPEKERLWNESKLQIQETIVNTLRNLDINPPVPVTVTSKKTEAAVADTELLRRIKALNFRSLQQEEDE